MKIDGGLKPNSLMNDHNHLSFVSDKSEMLSKIDTPKDISEPKARMYLVDTSSGNRVAEIKEGANVDVSLLKGAQYSIEAVVDNEKVGKVHFDVNGQKQTERVRPFAAFGNIKRDFDGENAILGKIDISLKFECSKGKDHGEMKTSFNFVNEHAGANPLVLPVKASETSMMLNDDMMDMNNASASAHNSIVTPQPVKPMISALDKLMEGEQPNNMLKSVSQDIPLGGQGPRNPSYSQSMTWNSAAKKIGVSEDALRKALGGGTYIGGKDQTRMSHQAVNVLDAVAKQVGRETMMQNLENRDLKLGQAEINEGDNHLVLDAVELSRAVGGEIANSKLDASYKGGRSANGNSVKVNGTSV